MAKALITSDLHLHFSKNCDLHYLELQHGVLPYTITWSRENND